MQLHSYCIERSTTIFQQHLLNFTGCPSSNELNRLMSIEQRVGQTNKSNTLYAGCVEHGCWLVTSITLFWLWTQLGTRPSWLNLGFSTLTQTSYQETVESQSYQRLAISQPLNCINLNCLWKMFDLKHTILISTWKRFAISSEEFQQIAISITRCSKKTIGSTVQQRITQQLYFSTWLNEAVKMTA